MLEQRAKAGHSIDVSDKIRQPDRWHAARHFPCEGECGFGLDGFDRWYPQALCANARIAATGLQPVCCFAKFLIQRFGRRRN